MQTIHITETTTEELIQGIGKEVLRTVSGILQQQEPEEKFLTRQQAADLLNVNLSTLYHWTKKSKVKAYGIGNRVYYKFSELEASLIPLN